ILGSVATALVAVRIGSLALDTRERIAAARRLPAAMAAVAGFFAVDLAAPASAPPAALIAGLLSALAAIDLATLRLPDILTLPLLLAAAALTPQDPVSSMGGMILAPLLMA